MSNLFDIKNQINDFLSKVTQVNTETGEMEGFDWEAFTQLEGDLEENIVEVARGMRNRESMLKARKDHLAEVQQKITRDEKKIERYLEYIGYFLAPEQSIERPDVGTIKWRKLADLVEIEDETKIPKAFKRQPETPDSQPDKKKLLATLKGGATVAGAKLITGRRKVQIS